MWASLAPPSGHSDTALTFLNTVSFLDVAKDSTATGVLSLLLSWALSLGYRGKGNSLYLIEFTIEKQQNEALISSLLLKRMQIVSSWLLAQVFWSSAGPSAER